MLTVNLLSVKKLCADNHSWLICDESQFFVQDNATWVILHHGKSSNNELFKIPVHFPTVLNSSSNLSAYLGHAIKSSLWHQRLGHPSNDILVVMLKDSHITYNTDDTTRICLRCINGKMCRLPFIDKIDRVDIPLYKVHSYVWGPSPTISLEIYRYYVSFVDEATRFV